MSVILFLALGCTPKGPRVDPLAAGQIQDPNAQFHKGVEYLTTPDRDGVRDYDAAYASFDAAARLLDGQASAAKAHFDAAWVAEQQGRMAEAAVHYRAALDADPSWDKALFSLGRVLEATDHAADAVASYRSYLASHPDRTDVRAAVVGALGAAGRYEAALEEARAILLEHRDDADTWRALSRVHLARGDAGLAALTAERALELDGREGGTANDLALAALAGGDEAAAVRGLRAAIERDPARFEPNMNLGWIAVDSGDYDLALTCFRRATDARPASGDARLGLALALRGRGQLVEADAAYTQAIRVQPWARTAYVNAAILHTRFTHDYDRALGYLDRWTAQSPAPDAEIVRLREEALAAQKAEKARRDLLDHQRELEAIEAQKGKAALAELPARAGDLRAKVASCRALSAEDRLEIESFLSNVEAIVSEKEGSMARDAMVRLEGAYLPKVSEACPE